MRQKVIGIVGGMGVRAALTFNSLLIDAYNVKNECDLPHIILDNPSDLPSRYDALMHDKAPLINAIACCINRLDSVGADLIILPCNAVHYFYTDIVSVSRLPVVNMIKKVSHVLVHDNCHQHALVIGAFITTELQLYSKYVPNCQYLQHDHRLFFYDIITSAKTKMEQSWSEKEIFDILGNYKFDYILLACTELTFLEGIISKEYKCFDSNRVFASAVIDGFKNLY